MQRFMVLRPAVEVDDYGDEVPGSLSEVGEVRGFFAPAGSTEVARVGQHQQVAGGTVYVRSATQPDVEPNDSIRINGDVFAVDGAISEWHGYAGYKGVQFPVKRTAG